MAWAGSSATPCPRCWARAALEDILSAAIAFGGTITGEHGVGRLKRDALPAMLGPDVMELNQRIKDALDPDGLLNPGAVLAQRVLGAP